jgi:hypothetical protein
MEYKDSQVRDFIKKVVDESKRTAKVETGFLKRSIRGNWFNKKATFRQIFYGAYNGNSQLIANAERIMPKEIDWSVIFTDEEGRETTVKGKTRSGRNIRRSAITSTNLGTDKIKQLISSLKITNGGKKDVTTKGSGTAD